MKFRTMLLTVVAMLIVGAADAQSHNGDKRFGAKTPTPKMTVTQRQTLAPRTQKKGCWLKRVLNATWRYPLGAGLRLTLLNDAGNFYEDGGTYPR